MFLVLSLSGLTPYHLPSCHSLTTRVTRKEREVNVVRRTVTTRDESGEGVGAGWGAGHEWRVTRGAAHFVHLTSLPLPFVGCRREAPGPWPIRRGREGVRGERSEPGKRRRETRHGVRSERRERVSRVPSRLFPTSLFLHITRSVRRTPLRGMNE